MKALIVAAGKGQRINGEGIPKPKPLYTCAGKYLIEHVITRLQKAGITEIFIVVGFMKEKIIEALGDGSRYNLIITYIHNDEFDKANGVSVYKAKSYLHEPFILAMSDHIFQQDAVTRFLNAMINQTRCHLYVDLKLDSISDIDDATKVLQENNAIKAIHKTLTNYNAIDTGMFYLTPAFFAALEHAQSQGDFSITGGVQVLANRNEMYTFDIGKYRWMDIDTRKELAILESEYHNYNS